MVEANNNSDDQHMESVQESMQALSVDPEAP